MCNEIVRPVQTCAVQRTGTLTSNNKKKMPIHTAYRGKHAYSNGGVH